VPYQSAPNITNLLGAAKYLNGVCPRFPRVPRRRGCWYYCAICHAFAICPHWLGVFLAAYYFLVTVNNIVWYISDNRVNTARFQAGQNVQAVGMIELV
jgi:hypothetical protein